MQHLEGSGTPVLYIGRKVLKGQLAECSNNAIFKYGQYNFWASSLHILLPHKRQRVQPYLYRGFPALSLNQSTMYTRSSRVVGSMSQGNVTLRPRTASTPTVLTATSSKKTCVLDKTGLRHVRLTYILI